MTKENYFILFYFDWAVCSLQYYRILITNRSVKKTYRDGNIKSRFPKKVGKNFFKFMSDKNVQSKSLTSRDVLTMLTNRCYSSLLFFIFLTFYSPTPGATSSNDN